ncbi:MAG TPA: HD domain-containing phosphohydrolase [bacterium]|nr:HD domain-containing phosphohydrolase [bacterium]
MQESGKTNLGNILLSLSDAIDLADPDISMHQLRTAYIAWKLSESLCLTGEQVSNIFIASLLHDVGAITSEEKIALHRFEEVHIQLHCIKGALLLGRVPEFARLGKYVRYHHTEWAEWQESAGSIEAEYVLGSQILLLSDLAERLINRGQHILLQTDSIRRHIGTLRDQSVEGKLVDQFLEISKSEEFWLDIVSPRLYSLLFSQGPLRSIEVGNDRLEMISKLFKDLIDFKSPYTATHTSGVAACAEMISKLYGCNESEIQSLRIASNLHDLGKLAVPTSILNKPGGLTREEFAIIKSHTYYSYNIINSIGGLHQIAEEAAFHHERLDGSGYPFHITGERMSVGARIIAIADIFTALIEVRPYREGMGKAGMSRIMSQMAKNGFIDYSLVSLLFDEYDSLRAYVANTQIAAKEFYSTRVDNMNIDN